MKTNPLAFVTAGPNPLLERHTLGTPTITTDHASIHNKLGFTLAGKMDIASAKVGVIQINPPANVAASVTIDMTNAASDLTYTAVNYGTEGNAITVTHVDPSGNDQPLAVSVTGTDISVSLATDGAGTITSTAAEVKAAVNAHAEASLLVTCEDEGDGTGVVNAAVETALTGGTYETYVHFKAADLICTAGPLYVSLIEDATFTGNSSTLTPVNRNRVGTVPASVVVCSASVDGTVVNGDNVLTLGTFLLPGTSTGSKTGTSSKQAEEWVLAPGKHYLLAISNATSPGATVTVGYDIFWYEEEGT